MSRSGCAPTSPTDTWSEHSDYNDTAKSDDSDTVRSDDDAGSPSEDRSRSPSVAGSDPPQSEEEEDDEAAGSWQGSSSRNSLTLSDDEDPALDDPTKLSTEARRNLLREAINASNRTRANLVSRVEAAGGIPEDEEFDDFRG